MEKQRVDVLLVTQGLFDTRERAKRAVMAGEILGDNEAVSYTHLRAHET